MECDVVHLKELASTIPTTCPCCNTCFTYEVADVKNRNTSPSFDRVDNNKGYIKGNVVIICNRCNSLKKDGTIADFENIIRYIKAANE